MPTPITFAGGTLVPTVGTSGYIQAQQGIAPAGTTTVPTPASFTSTIGGATPTIPNPSAPTTINSSNTGQTSPVNLPATGTYVPPLPATVPPPTGTTTGTNGAATVNPPAAPSPYQDILKKLGEQGDALATKGSVTTQLQNENQLAQKTERATQDYNAYTAKKLEYQQTIEKMSSSGNLTDAGRSASIRDYSRAANADLANLAIQAQASQGLLTAAQQTIKDKLDAQFQPIQEQIDYLTKFAQLNQNDLSESEKFKLQTQIEQKKADTTAVQKVANDLHQAVLDNGNPPGVLSALDKVTNDFVSGKITAAEAQSQLYSAAGKYGGDILAQKTKEAQLTNILLNSSKIQAETDKLKASVNDAGDTVAGLASQLIGGTLAPSDLSKRATGTGSYNDVLNAANKLSLSTTGKPFDIAKANRDYKYATNIGTQNTLKYLGSLVGGTGQTGNLDELLNISNSIDRSKFPALNNVQNWSKLETGDPAIASYHAVVTEVADQVAKILQGGGTGSGSSDAKLNQALSLFRSDFSKDQLTAVVNSLRPLLTNRAKSMIGDNAYLSDYADQFGFGKPSTTSDSAPVDYRSKYGY